MNQQQEKKQIKKIGRKGKYTIKLKHSTKIVISEYKVTLLELFTDTELYMSGTYHENVLMTTIIILQLSEANLKGRTSSIFYPQAGCVVLVS